MNPTRYEELMAELRTIRAYLSSINQIQGEIDLLLYDMANVRAIRYDREPAHAPESVREERRLELIEEKAEKERELDMTVLAYGLIRDRCLKALDEQEPLIRDVLLDRFGLSLGAGEFAVEGRIKTYEELGDLYGYTSQGLYSKIKREIK